MRIHTNLVLHYLYNMAVGLVIYSKAKVKKFGLKAKASKHPLIAWLRKLITVLYWLTLTYSPSVKFTRMSSMLAILVQMSRRRYTGNWRFDCVCDLGMWYRLSKTLLPSCYDRILISRLNFIVLARQGQLEGRIHLLFLKWYREWHLS